MRPLEYRDFVLATKDDTTICSLDYIGLNLNQYVDAIYDAFERGETYIQVNDHESIVEIQWEYK